MWNSIVLKATCFCLPFLKKRIYSRETFEKDFKIDVSQNNPVTIDLQDSSPQVRFGFDLTNRSEYLDITFDRALISLDLSHYHIFRDAPMVKECEISRKEDVYTSFEVPLNLFQRDAICKVIKEKRIGEIKATVDITYYLKSSLHDLQGYERLEQRHCEVVNASDKMKDELGINK